MLTDVKPVLEELNDVLSSLIVEHRKLGDTIDILRLALVECDHERIKKLGHVSECISAEIRQLETRRHSILEDSEFFDGDSHTFSSMENALASLELDDETQSELEKSMKLREELAGIIHQVDHDNQLNLTLVGQALGFHEFCLQMLLNSAGAKTSGYSRDGSSRSDDGAGFVDGMA